MKEILAIIIIIHYLQDCQSILLYALESKFQSIIASEIFNRYDIASF